MKLIRIDVLTFKNHKSVFFIFAKMFYDFFDRIVS